MSDVDYRLKTGDTRPVIEETIDAKGDLTESGVSVTFTLTPAEGRATPVIDGATAVVEGANTVSYTLDTADTQNPGEYFAEFEVNYSDGGVETFPKGKFYFVKVTEDL